MDGNRTSNVWGISILFILSAADKRHSNKKHNSNYGSDALKLSGANV